MCMICQGAVAPQTRPCFLAGGVVPGVSRHAFKTPFSEGVQSFPVWRPWLDAADAENILFARCCTPLKLPTDVPV